MHANTLFLLASAPYAAAHLHPASVYGSMGSNGSCYDPSTHIITCRADWATCVTPLVFYPLGHVASSGNNAGCCHCDSNCDHANEATGAECNYYDENAGSCKNAVTGKVTCDVKASQCASPNTWSAAGALDSDGCCFCDESCDHSLETGTDCDKGPYADISQSDGSCYAYGGGSKVYCDVGKHECVALSSSYFWYAPGYMSGMSGCCHCDASCDHTLESGTDCVYYGSDGTKATNGTGHGAEYTFAPTSKPVSIDAAATTTVGVLAAAAAGVAALL